MNVCPYASACRRCRRLLGRELTSRERISILAALDLHQSVIAHEGKLKVLERQKPAIPPPHDSI